MIDQQSGVQSFPETATSRLGQQRHSELVNIGLAAASVTLIGACFTIVQDSKLACALSVLAGVGIGAALHRLQPAHSSAIHRQAASDTLSAHNLLPAVPMTTANAPIIPPYLEAHQALVHRLEELSLIEDMSRQLSSTLEFDQIVDKMLDIALRITLANSVSLSTLTEAGSSWLVMQRTAHESPVRKTYRTRGREDGVIGLVMRSHQSVFIPDLQDSEFQLEGRGAQVRSLTAVPLISDDTVIGVLTIENESFGTLNESEQRFLRHLAEHTVISIQNSRLLEEHRHRINVLSSLQYLSQRLAAGLLNRVTVEQAVLETVRRLIEADEAMLLYYDDTEDALVPLSASGGDNHAAPPSPSVFPPHLALNAVRNGEIQVSYHTLPLAAVGIENLPPLTLVSVPIKHEGAVRAVLCITFSDHRHFHKRDLEGLSLLASQAGEQLERAKLHERIRAQNDRMSAILKSTRDGVILLDDEGRLVECNAAAERLLGISGEEFSGKNFVGMLFQMPKQTNELSGMGYSRTELVEMARLLRVEPSRITKREFKRTKADATIYIEEIGAPVLDASQRIVGRLLVLRDVTESKMLNDYRRDIMNMTVHDLRGPLASVISGLGIALEDLHDPTYRGDVEKMLNLSLDSASHLLQLVESVLDIARLESREMPLHPVHIDLSNLVQSAVGTLSHSFTASNIRLEVQIPKHIAQVVVDKDLIRRVLLNLLDNAYRHTPPDGSVLVSTRTTPGSPDQVTVLVCDSGSGIPASEQKRVFEAFRQVSGTFPQRGSGGSGLGLTFCKLAVEAHHGEIWVEKEGILSGACIAFTLPTKAKPAAPVAR